MSKQTKIEVETLGEYPTEQIFTEVDGQFEMKIPKEISDRLGLDEGDQVKIELGDKGTMIISKVIKNEA
jgi:AbrB family looped-hinge helix DNA binding protein